MTKAEAKNPSLRDLLAQPVPLVVGEITLQIAPMGWHQASCALEHLLPAAGALPLLAGGDDAQDRFAQWLGVIVTYRDEVAAFAAEASALPIDEVRALPPAAMAELMVGLVEINLDFFVRSLPALAQRWNGRLGALGARLDAAAAASASTTSSSA